MVAAAAAQVAKAAMVVLGRKEERVLGRSARRIHEPRALKRSDATQITKACLAMVVTERMANPEALAVVAREATAMGLIATR